MGKAFNGVVLIYLGAITILIDLLIHRLQISTDAVTSYGGSAMIHYTPDALLLLIIGIMGVAAIVGGAIYLVKARVRRSPSP